MRMIGEELVKQYFTKGWSFDAIVGDVRIIARRGGFIILDEEHPIEEWSETSQLADSVRFGLRELFNRELSAFKSELDLEIERVEPRVTYPDFTPVEVLEKPELPSPRALVETWLRDIVGLERRARPRVSISNIARTKLRASDTPAKRQRVHEARRIIKATKKKKR